MPGSTSADPNRPRPPLPRSVRLSAVFRSAALYCGLWLIVTPGVLTIANMGSDVLRATLWGGGVVLILLAALGTRAPADVGPSLVVASPVGGRWMALNSPSSKVPSHGTHLFGQTYGIDFVHEGAVEGSSVRGRRNSVFLRPEAFPSYARPIFAVADGTVARVKDGQRDHKSRLNRAGVLYFAIEAFVRGLGPPSLTLGNHLILRLPDGSHMLYAHLRQSSIRVTPGDRVAMGEVVADCGNSGNSTIPHLHIQRQDIAAVLGATGLPWSIAADGEWTGGLPRNGQVGHFGPASTDSKAPCA